MPVWVHSDAGTTSLNGPVYLPADRFIIAGLEGMPRTFAALITIAIIDVPTFMSLKVQYYPRSWVVYLN
jgi:hypothetical protein